MNTKFLMAASASYLGLVGVILIFLPQETATLLGLAPQNIGPLLLQIIGALYIGFAMLNWMTKNTLLGGIYGKPLVVGNMTHFFISAISIAKVLKHVPSSEIYPLAIPCAIGFIFAAFFGYLFFRNPIHR